MQHTFKQLFFLVVAAVFALPIHAQISDFSEDFESVDPTSATAISELGFVTFGNVFDSGLNFCYGYGPDPAPNSTNDSTPDAFSGIAIDVGGGLNSLNIFSDYQNGDHNNGKFIQANVFREVTPDANDVGRNVCFEFDFRAADAPNGPSGQTETFAFIRVIDPDNMFALVDEFLFETTMATTEFQSGAIEVEIIPFYEGRLFQYGFYSQATASEPSGIFYDNISLGDKEDCILGDTNGDGEVSLLDVAPFVASITGPFQCEADINQDGVVDLLDVKPFVALITN